MSNFIRKSLYTTCVYERDFSGDGDDFLRYGKCFHYLTEQDAKDSLQKAEKTKAWAMGEILNPHGQVIERKEWYMHKGRPTNRHDTLPKQ